MAMGNARKLGVAIGALALGLGQAVAAQTVDGEDVKDVAQTPLEDVGLSKEDISQILLAAAENPYAAAGNGQCSALIGEIAKLDNILGDDYDIAADKEEGISTKKAAKSVVGSIIPFRGVVREISGAAGNERKAEAAIAAGMVRRGYLKGLGEAKGCRYPARPKPE
ncbi:MAG: hypothetical protein AAGH57_12720 [Pseudomonadota bacterium]